MSAQRAAAADRAPAPVIDAQALAKTYLMGEEAVHALADVSVQAKQGDYLAIMGSSGSGKSTLMHILGCLDVPSTGTYLLDGVDVADLDADELSDIRNRKIGFVFQSFNLIASASALANVELPLAYAGLGRSARRERARQALAAVGLENRLGHLPSELSGGQQQRVALARALVTAPVLILADEPTGNLDSHSTADVLELFDALNASGRTIVLITHEHDVAARARRVIRLADGRVVEERDNAG